MSRTHRLSLAALALAALSLSSLSAHAQLNLRYESFQVPGTNPFVGSLAHGISANGTVWATSVDSDFVAHGAVGRPNGTFTRLDYPGSVGTNTQGLGFLPGTVSFGGINNAGDTTGVFYYFDAVGDGQQTNFIYHNGTFNSPMVAGSTFTSYNNVNEAGLVAAVYVDAVGHTHGAVYDLATSSFTTVPDVPGYTLNSMQTITPDGAFLRNVGTGGVDPVTDDDLTRGSLTRNGVTTFFDFPGALDTRADAITSKGLVSGNYLDANHNRRGFVYDSIGDIWQSVDIPGSVYTTLRLGNSDNQFVGWWNDANGGYHSLIVTQVPEPGTIALFVGMASVGVTLRRRKNRK